MSCILIQITELNYFKNFDYCSEDSMKFTNED